MEELIDLISSDGSPSEITDRINTLLYAKAGEKVNSLRPEVASLMFGEDEDDDQSGENE